MTRVLVAVVLLAVVVLFAFVILLVQSVVYWATDQNCTKKNLYEDNFVPRMKLARGCTKILLHEDKFARGDKTAPRVNFARVTILHESKKRTEKKTKR